MLSKARRNWCALALIVAASHAHAVAVDWVISDHEFQVPPSASGSVDGGFTYDADVMAFSDITIEVPDWTLANGLVVPGFVYTLDNAFITTQSPGSLHMRSNDFLRWFQFVWVAPLTNDGGALDIQVHFAETIFTSVGVMTRVASGGQLIGSPVPLPPAGWLLVAGLAVLAPAGQRRLRVAPA